jgi:hypothetical protein
MRCWKPPSNVKRNRPTPNDRDRKAPRGHTLRAEDEIPQFVDRVLGKPPKLQDLRTALIEFTGDALMPSPPKA